MIAHIKNTHPIQNAKASVAHAQKAHKILVSLDGTRDSERALPLASDVARRTGAALQLVYVREPHYYDNSRDLFLVDDGKSLSFRSPAEAYLDVVADRLRAEHRVAVTWTVLVGAWVEDALRSACDGSVSMIIMARSNRTWLSRILTGSPTNSLLRRLPVPLLVVAGAATSDKNRDRPLFQRILLPLSGSPAETAADLAISLASPFGAEYRLLRVLPQRVLMPRLYHQQIETPWLTPDAYELRADAWRDLGSVQKRLTKLGSAATARVVFSQSSGEAIVTEASGFHPDLIALTWKWHFLPWWLRDGVPEYVMRTAKTNLLIVPDKFVTPTSLGAENVDQYSQYAQCA